MDTNDARTERAWLTEVCARLPGITPPAPGEVRRLLRVTKVTADATGVRYLAPLTAYLIGRAAERAGETFDLGAAVDAISELAEGWERTPEG